MSPQAPSAYSYLTASGLIKSGPGILHAINMAAPADTCQILLYDNISAVTGTILLVMKAVVNTTASHYLGNVAFSRGLYAVLSGTSPAVTIIYS